MLRLFLAAAFLLAGCASAPPGAVVSARHPAVVVTPTASLSSPTTGLTPVRAPRLPAALRRADRPPVAMHGADAHGGSDVPADTTALTIAPGSVATALDAYLTVHAALTSDDLDAATAAARPLADALGHAGASHALMMAADLAAAREAFGALSPAFLDAVDAAGIPEGYDLVRMRCGMAKVAEGGVWMQRQGDTLNPYFGQAMRTCGRPAEAASSDAVNGDDAEGHHAH